MLSALVFPKIVCAGSDILGFYEETIPGEEIGPQQSVVKLREKRIAATEQDVKDWTTQERAQE